MPIGFGLFEAYRTGSEVGREGGGFASLQPPLMAAIRRLTFDAAAFRDEVLMTTSQAGFCSHLLESAHQLLDNRFRTTKLVSDQR